uniref:Reverse transcriptase domain-containing protein n=1 Tax=Amphimedon queenslandica TaxID=400682 RepID=A0A1X7U9C3_AMPQE
MMDEILRGTETFAGVYLDDIVIHTSKWRDHLKQLTDVLKRLDDAGLTIKLKKCTFGARESMYLGYQIGKGGVRPERRKIEAIINMARP